jgi:hypothetical protein
LGTTGTGGNPLVHGIVVHGPIILVHSEDEPHIMPTTEECQISGEYGFELVRTITGGELYH